MLPISRTASVRDLQMGPLPALRPPTPLPFRRQALDLLSPARVEIVQADLREDLADPLPVGLVEAGAGERGRRVELQRPPAAAERQVRVSAPLVDPGLLG